MRVILVALVLLAMALPARADNSSVPVKVYNFSPGQTIASSQVNRDFDDLYTGLANVGTANLLANAVTTAKIAAANITNALLAASSVSSSNIIDGTIATVDLANLAVTAAKIASATITQTQMANASIGTAQLIDANVTTAKILDANVTTAKITDANVTNAKMAASSVSSSNIIDGTIATADIANLAVTGAKMANATVAQTQIANAAVGTAQLIDANVTLAKMATNSVGTSQIVASAVTNSEVAQHALGYDRLASASMYRHIDGIKIDYVTTASASITWTQVVLTDGTDFVLANANTVTVNMATTGAGALDTGSIAAGQTYYFYVIGQSGGTINVLASASSSSPTMPGGYSFKRRVGSIRTVDGSAALPVFHQTGNQVIYSDLRTTSLSGGTATGASNITVSSGASGSNFPVPVTARSFTLVCQANMNSTASNCEASAFFGPNDGTSLATYLTLSAFALSASAIALPSQGTVVLPYATGNFQYKVTVHAGSGITCTATAWVIGFTDDI